METNTTFTVTAGAVTVVRSRYGIGLPMTGSGVQVHTVTRKASSTIPSTLVAATFDAVNDDTRAFRTWSPPV